MTILALDHRIFGNGWGMATPHFDGRFYWLSGDLYHFFPGFGAQLTSYQWRHPRAGESRELAGYSFVPFRSTRRGIRVEVKWCWTRLPRDLDEANAALRKMEADLGRIR